MGGTLVMCKKPFSYIKLSRKPLSLLTLGHYYDSYLFIAQSLIHDCFIDFFPSVTEKFSSNAPRKQNASFKRKTCSALKVTRQSKGHDEFKRRQCIY